MSQRKLNICLKNTCLLWNEVKIIAFSRKGHNSLWSAKKLIRTLHYVRWSYCFIRSMFFLDILMCESWTKKRNLIRTSGWRAVYLVFLLPYFCIMQILNIYLSAIRLSYQICDLNYYACGDMIEWMHTTK